MSLSVILAGFPRCPTGPGLPIGPSDPYKTKTSKINLMRPSGTGLSTAKLTKMELQ